MSILTNLRNIFPFPFLHNLRGAPSQTVDVDACYAFIRGKYNKSISGCEKGLKNLIKFCKNSHILVWGNI